MKNGNILIWYVKAVSSGYGGVHRHEPERADIFSFPISGPLPPAKSDTSSFGAAAALTRAI